MKPFDDSKIIKVNAELEASFKEERDKWVKWVEDLLQSMKKNSELSDTMILGLSYRQQIIEKVAYYRQVMYKKKSQMDVLRMDRYKKYMVEGDLRFTTSERNDVVNADLTSINYQLSLLQNQIDFLLETNQTLTNIQFAIKNKITLLTEEIM